MMRSINSQRFISLVFLLLVASLTAASHAATIVQWGPSGQNTGDIFTTGTDKPGNSLSIAPGVSSVLQSGDAFVKGSGVTFSTSGAANASTDGWLANDINIAGLDAADAATAITGNDYISLIFTSTTAFTLNEFGFQVWRNGGQAAQNYFASYKVGVGAQVNGSTINVANVGYNNGTMSPFQLATISQTGLSVAVPANTNLEVRLYAFNAGNTTGNTHVTGGFINGVPEPATYVLSGIGLVGLFGIARRKSACTR